MNQTCSVMTCRAVPRLTGEAARNLIASATALAATLWQTANPGEVLAKVYAEDRSLAHARAEFAPRMTQILDALITGLITQAHAPVPAFRDEQPR